MSGRPIFCGARSALFGLWLAGAAIAFDSLADPLLSDATDPRFSVPIGDDRLLQMFSRSAVHPAVSELPLPHPLLEIAKFDADGGSARDGQDSAPATRRAPSRNQLARDWRGDVAPGQSLPDSIHPSNQTSAPASGQERASQSAAYDSRFREAEFAQYPEATFRDAAGDALHWTSNDDVDGKDVARFFLARFGEFRTMLKAELRSIAASVSDLSPAAPYEYTWSQPEVSALSEMQRQSPSSGTATASGQFSGFTQTDPSIGDLADFITFMLREFFTNPTAIIATFGTLIMWKSFELILEIRRRRQRRHASSSRRVSRVRAGHRQKLRRRNRVPS